MIGEGDGGSQSPAGAPPDGCRINDCGHLARVAKKAKANEEVSLVSDEAMGDVQGELQEEVTMTDVPQLPERQIVSYRDLVVGMNGTRRGMKYAEDEKDWMEDDLSDDEMEEDGNGGFKYKDLGPGVDVRKEERINLCQPWRKSLIIKVLGKEVGYRFLLNRIQKLWAPKGTLDMIDFKNNYFLVTFSSDQDLDYALQEGPWMIAGHYLLCQRWRPEFKPFEDHVRKQAVWVRVPELPIEYYKKNILWEVGNEIGRTLRVDVHTINEEKLRNGVRATERGQFARICVEVDLRKALLPIVRVRKTWYKVEYEGLPLICFECGRFGHRLEQCPTKFAPSPASQMADKPSDGKSTTAVHPSSGQQNSGESESGFFGPWMIAQRNSRKPHNPRGANSKNHANENPARFGNEAEKSPIKNKDTGGNRFDIIADLMEEDSAAVDDVAQNEIHSVAHVGRNVACNLNQDLAGHRVIPNANKPQRSPAKITNAGPNGSKNSQRSKSNVAHHPPMGPLKISESNKLPRSPQKSSTVSRNKDKAIVVGPMKESKAQNIIPRTGPKEKASTSKASLPSPTIRTGPDIHHQEPPPKPSTEDLLRMMRYERHLLAEQGRDSLDDLPVLRVHSNDI